MKKKEVKKGQDVFFNEERVAEFDKLKKAGYISSDFKTFVRSAFHDKLDQIKKIAVNGGEQE